VVALDAKTGKQRWYFQFTPHDTHDYDSAQVPVLVYDDSRADGGVTLSWANRNGFFYSLDAVTGRFLQGRPYARQTWAKGLGADGRAIPLSSAEPTPDGTLVWPSSDGATNWKPSAYDRKLGNLYVPMQERPGIMFLGDASKPSAGHWFGGGATQGVEGIPIYNAIQALDARTGELRWEHRFPSKSGALDRGVEFGGLLVTAGGLVFGSSRSTFCALDARTGKELWSFDVGTPIYAAPITYSVNGRQMIAIAAGRVVMGFALDTTVPAKADAP
jgi:alcohol dehydrogenase (cytochrome c)